MESLIELFYDVDDFCQDFLIPSIRLRAISRVELTG
jgi:hypothetical protein